MSTLVITGGAACRIVQWIAYGAKRYSPAADATVSRTMILATAATSFVTPNRNGATVIALAQRTPAAETVASNRPNRGSQTDLNKRHARSTMFRRPRIGAAGYRRRP